MESFIAYKMPDQPFWQDYENLWNNSISRSVFQSPHFIRFLAHEYRDALAVFECRIDGVLKGAAFFKKENNVYSFLSDVKSDHNFFIIHNDCDGETVAVFFELFFEKVRRERWKLLMQKQPADAAYMGTLIDKGQSSKLFWTESKQSVCPVLQEASPEALSDTLSKSKKALRNIKALSKLQGIEFEVFQSDEDLENWANEFFDLHISRWENTPTPSMYEQPGKRPFMIRCMRAWIADGVLIRFSLRFGNKRASYCWGFIQGQTFIAHAQAYDAEFSRNSPIKVLINYIGQWIRNQNLNTMDFGYGNDEYKYDFANKEVELKSIIVSGSWNLTFIAKSKLKHFVRQNRELHRFLKGTVKPLFQRIFFTFF
jgi:CelD/BcsL family acetyltransferase involved in cellulose biosynthesis